MKNDRFMDEALPKFYGSTTIGERGQLVVPAEARKDLGIMPSSKVLVFSSPGGEGLLIFKADSVVEILSKTSQFLNGVAEVLQTNNSKQK